MGWLAQCAKFTPSTELWNERALSGEFCAKKAVCWRTEEKREEERKEERDSVWAVGGGFWLKIEPLSFSPLAGFFVWQALGTAAIQVAVKMKE